MFSVTNTGICALPLCTEMVWPTMAGTTVEARDQVRITRFSREALSFSTFSIRWSATKGPFFNERLIYLLRLRTIILAVRLLRRVFLPIVICPQGVVGGRPDVERASPPPCG